MSLLRPAALCLSALLAGCAPREPDAEPVRPVYVSEAAPADRPVAVGDSAAAAFFASLAPRVGRARAAWPEVVARFRRGLPAGSTLFVTTRLRDAGGRVEQVFVAVDRMAAGEVAGRVWSDIQLVDGFRKGQPVSVQEQDILDWTITLADGSEEGNYIGKYVDSLQAGLLPVP